MMSRHYLWLCPLANAALFALIGIFLALLAWFWPRLGSWVASRVLGALVIVPALMIAAPWIFPEAWFLFALGISVRIIGWLEHDIAGAGRFIRLSFPAIFGIIGFLAASLWITDRWKERLEAARPMPAPRAPNFLLITLDTVRADRLSLYGYSRPTTPTLERLARRGVRFDRAIATAPWTLPSHASMMTGRYPHEFGDEWMTPVEGRFPTIAEYLGDRGYRTVGIVANTGYCSSETGLARGFTHYEDYELNGLTPLRTSVIVEEALRSVLIFASRQRDGGSHTLGNVLNNAFRYRVRRNAASVSRGFLQWLSAASQPERPFFAFINYLDAHAPYELPPGATQRFGRAPRTTEEIHIIHESWASADKTQLPRPYLIMASDAYDSCLSYLDEQLGVLLDELERRGILENTFVVITADHGEGFGEHNLFDHGQSLYQPEIRVPLLILPPGQKHAATAISETVSLADLPATIADLGPRKDSSVFPGSSLADLILDVHAVKPDGRAPAFCELRSPNPSDPNRERSPAIRGRLRSLARGDLSYIRREADASEELFDVKRDPGEFINRVDAPAYGAELARFREELARAMKGREVGAKRVPLAAEAK